MGGEKREHERGIGLGRSQGNLISVLIKPNLFWRVTETALCHYADLQDRGEEKRPRTTLLKRANERHQ